MLKHIGSLQWLLVRLLCLPYNDTRLYHILHRPVHGQAGGRHSPGPKTASTVGLMAFWISRLTPAPRPGSPAYPMTIQYSLLPSIIGRKPAVPPEEWRFSSRHSSLHGAACALSQSYQLPRPSVAVEDGQYEQQERQPEQQQE